jgi:hypothetical protein
MGSSAELAPVADRPEKATRAVSRMGTVPLEVGKLEMVQELVSRTEMVLQAV